MADNVRVAELETLLRCTDCQQSRQQFAAGDQAAAACVMVVPEIGAEVAI